jgi:hypothetical protein
MPAAVRFFRHRLFERHLVNHDIHAAGQFPRRLAGGGIAENSQLLPGVAGRVAAAVNPPSIFQLNR